MRNTDNKQLILLRQSIMSNKIEELESKYQFLVEKIVKERSS